MASGKRQAEVFGCTHVAGNRAPWAAVSKAATREVRKSLPPLLKFDWKFVQKSEINILNRRLIFLALSLLFSAAITTDGGGGGRDDDDEEQQVDHIELVGCSIRSLVSQPDFGRNGSEKISGCTSHLLHQHQHQHRKRLT